MSRPDWLVPAFGFVLVNGLLGVMAKLALRHVSLGDVVAWTCAVYAGVGIVVLATGQGRLSSGVGGGFAALTGACAAGGLIFSVLALRTARASEAAPFMASYPIVTVLLAVVILSERLEQQEIAGIALVIAGLIVLAT